MPDRIPLKGHRQGTAFRRQRVQGNRHLQRVGRAFAPGQRTGENIRQANVVGRQQLHVPINAAKGQVIDGIPEGGDIRPFAGIHADQQAVLPFPQPPGGFQGKGGVATPMAAKAFPVQKNLGAGHDAFEMEEGTACRLGGVRLEKPRIEGSVLVILFIKIGQRHLPVRMGQTDRLHLFFPDGFPVLPRIIQPVPVQVDLGFHGNPVPFLEDALLEKGARPLPDERLFSKSYPSVFT